MDAEDKIRARNLRNMGLSWNEVARKLGVSVIFLRRAIDADYVQRRRLYGKVHRAKCQKQRGRSDFVNCATHAATRRMAERLLSDLPQDTRNITARLMGDPLPGRSALDRRAR